MSKQLDEMNNNTRNIKGFSSSYSYPCHFPPIGFVIVDEEGKIVELSGSALKSLLYRGELKEKSSFLWVIHNDDRELFSVHLKNFFKTGRTQSCEIRFITERDSAFHAQLDCLVCENREGKSLCKVLLSEVISHNTVFENLKERTEDIKEQSERKIKLMAMGELASVIGHELRNPLCVISNSVYYLNMKLNQVDDKVKKHLTIIQDEVSRADQILSEVLDFSRSRHLTLIDGKVSSLIIALLSTLKIPDGIIITTDFADEGITTLLDPEQLKKAVLNMIVNAFQAMPDGGRLDIGTKVNRNCIEISVKDTGKGIDDENIERIFDPLFTTRPKGIGLGLTIAQDIINKHKGTIRVESKPSPGTTFTVSLPLKEV